MFKPATALRLDLVSLLSLVSVLATVRFTNLRYDILAAASVALWLLRTVFAYSNARARYDLLVKRFVTSKIALRGAGVVRWAALTTHPGAPGGSPLDRRVCLRTAAPHPRHRRARLAAL